MNASKENARKANKNLWTAAEMLDRAIPSEATRNEVKRVLIQVLSFVEAAERKLPTEAAYERDANRRKAKAGK